MTRFLADENIPAPLISELRALGFDVISVAELASGEDDRDIIHRFKDDRRILITRDTDFGELTIRHELPFHGIILLRSGKQSPKADNARALEVLTSPVHFTGFFTTVGKDKTRQRPLLVPPEDATDSDEAR